MKRISLTGKWARGMVALVDSGDFDYLNKWKWVLLKNGYPARNVYLTKGKRVMTPLHRFLVENNGNKLVVDHINRNKLDNRRKNLRLATRSVNGLNRIYKPSTIWRHRGVSWHKNNKAWRVQIGIGGKNTHLGYYKTLKEADKIYKINFLKSIANLRKLV